VRLFYVDDQLVDLRANTVIAQTLQVYDPGKVGSVTTNYTSSIKAPRTFGNDQIFGYLGNSKTKSDVPYTSLGCRYQENGLPIIRNGRVIVSEVNEQDYSLQVFSGPWGFFEIIQDKTLWDLDFDDLNGPWEQSDRDGYRNATTGILQALLDDGLLESLFPPVITWQEDTIRSPQIYYHTVLEKIFSSFGFEYEGDIFTNDVYKKLAIPLAVVYRDPSFLEAKVFSAAADGEQEIINPVTEVSVIFDQNVRQGSDGFYDGTSEYVVVNADTPEPYVTMIFRANLTIVVTGGTVDIILQTDSATVFTPDTELNKGSGTYELSFGPPLADGDIIKVTIVNNTGTPTVDVTSAVFYSYPFTGIEDENDETYIPTIRSEYVYFQKLFEEVKLIDFIREFCVRFNCQITQINNVLQVNTLNYILDQRTGPDWTYKRDKVSNRIRYIFNSYGQTNVIKSPVDSNYTPNLTSGYGDGSFTIPNENIRETLNIYTSLYSVSEMIQRLGVFMLKLNVRRGGDESSIATELIRYPGNRLFFVRAKYDFEPDVLYDAIDRSDYLVAYYFDPSQEYDLSWQFFVDTFHQKYVDRCLRKIRLIEREYNLSDLDIFKFNQQIPIWDNGERFLVTKIINRVSRKVCKVELLKIEPNPEHYFTATAVVEITGDIEDTMEVISDNVSPVLAIQMELIENVVGNPTWITDYDNTLDTDTRTCTGNGANNSSTLNPHTGALSVNADVLKTFNDGNGPDGFPVAAGYVEWLRNGVQVNTATFDGSSHSSAQGLNYTYLNVVAWEVLKVIVREDGSSP